MPHYPLPIPAHVIEAVDSEDRAQYGDAWVARRIENRAAIQKISATINDIYDSGTPFFTKNAIRDLVRQIDESGIRPVQTEPISLEFPVKGIDGRTVKLPVELGVKLGKPRPRGDEGSGELESDGGAEQICAKLCVDFRPIDHLTSLAAFSADHFHPDRAFLPFMVEVLVVRVLPSGELVLRRPINPVPETRAIMQRQREEWDAGDASRQVMATLETHANAVGGLPRVDKVVAFACSNPSDVERAERVAREHALVLSLRDFFARQHQPPATSIPCYAQDPQYIDVDCEVLRELGVTVLDNPRGFLEVDESTAVFSQCPDVPIRQIIADMARPAVMVWDRVREIPRDDSWAGTAVHADNISPRVEDMVRNHYVELPFPADLAGFGSHLAIYVRKD